MLTVGDVRIFKSVDDIFIHYTKIKNSNQKTNKKNDNSGIQIVIKLLFNNKCKIKIFKRSIF